jgi:hypothetical protein
MVLRDLRGIRVDFRTNAYCEKNQSLTSHPVLYVFGDLSGALAVRSTLPSIISHARCQRQLHANMLLVLLIV